MASITTLLSLVALWGTTHAAAVAGTSPYHGPQTATSSCGYPGGGPTATIDAGVVIGTTTSLPQATATVNKFLGVPFAKSPPERFAPPVSPGKFSQPIEAKQWSPACIQQFVYPKASQEFTEAVFNNPAPAESEDCLYVLFEERKCLLGRTLTSSCFQVPQRICSFHPCPSGRASGHVLDLRR